MNHSDPQFRRYRRGYSFHNRPLYGYRVVCSCGWEQRVNGTKREAEARHRAHVKEQESA